MPSPGHAIQPAPSIKKPAVVSEAREAEFLEDFNNRVAARAYQLYEELGRADGNDLSNWFQAEGELAPTLPNVREFGGSFVVTASLSGVRAEQTKIYTSTDQAIISGESSSGSSDGPVQGHRSLYYMVRWPQKIDPKSCEAEINGAQLTLTARKATESR